MLQKVAPDFWRLKRTLTKTSGGLLSVVSQTVPGDILVKWLHDFAAPLVIQRWIVKIIKEFV
jgi:hypothetical protein